MEYMTLLANIVGFVGGILGIVSWVTGMKREKQIQREQDEMWATYIGLHQAFEESGKNVWNPDIGSDDHRMAEKMVARGFLKPVDGGGYSLSGRLTF